ncbi:hypothetical protein FNH05_27565 [Amycolatopsis rhizosphaerae]|uniref:Uncharacterized protein n=1 Tax=Amycolatopsis rhizosphaerae TaxID=2053003 RepID=A0A558B8B1_9PSEU|nr:hypothetical protein [Amycolatopsis rhizosphaerae]TVT32746.1 hypothetical protein FNH05_27565 [Amycolatopsis rhizosphaerae]
MSGVTLVSYYDPPEWRTAAGELHLIVERQIGEGRGEIAVATVCDLVLAVTARDIRTPDAAPCRACSNRAVHNSVAESGGAAR